MRNMCVRSRMEGVVGGGGGGGDTLLYPRNDSSP